MKKNRKIRILDLWSPLTLKLLDPGSIRQGSNDYGSPATLVYPALFKILGSPLSVYTARTGRPRRRVWRLAGRRGGVVVVCPDSCRC